MYFGIKNGTEVKPPKEYSQRCGECGCEFIFTEDEFDTFEDPLFLKYVFVTCPEAFCAKKSPIRKDELWKLEYEEAI